MFYLKEKTFESWINLSSFLGGRCGIERLRRSRVRSAPRRDQTTLQLTRSAESCYREGPVHGVVPLRRSRPALGSAGRSGQHNTVPICRPTRTPAHHTPTLPQDWPHLPLHLRWKTSPGSSRNLRAKVNTITYNNIGVKRMILTVEFQNLYWFS